MKAKRKEQAISLKLGIIGAFSLACLFCIIGFSAIWLPFSDNAISYPTAVIQVIPAATFTSTPPPTQASATLNDEGGPQSSSSEVPIMIGDYVEIVGTQGDGLRLRSQPGLDGDIVFVAYEGEIFKVDDGPQDASGYHWWYLIAPYDETVRGWAVDNYLRVVQNH